MRAHSHVRRSLVQFCARASWQARRWPYPEVATSAARIAAQTAKCRFDQWWIELLLTLCLKDNDHSGAAHTNTLINLSEDPSSIRNPPTATVTRRAKSYSDFYRVVKAHLAKESKQIREREQFLSHPTTVSNNGLNFESIYDKYEDELLDSSQEGFQYVFFTSSLCRRLKANAWRRVYRDQLALSKRHLDGLLQDTSMALDLLADLSGSFKSVEAQTIAFQAQCQDVLAEQKRLKLLSDEVSAGLKYYAYLEPVTRRLNAPGASSVIGDDGFVEILTNLDACVRYLIAHVSFILLITACTCPA